MEKLSIKNGISTPISKPNESIDVDFSNVGTPEIYFGYQFTRGNLGNVNNIPGQTINYSFPGRITANNVYVAGQWKNNADNIELIGGEGEILLVYKAKALNIVAGSDNGSDAYVYLDNKIENEKNKGEDVQLIGNESISKIKEFRLYNLAASQDYDVRAINIQVKGNGFRIYTFTFG